MQERTYNDFAQSLTLAPNTQQAQKLYANAEEALMRAAVSDRKHRTWTRWVEFGMMTTYGAGLTYVLANGADSTRGYTALLMTVPTVIGGALFFESLFPTTTERMADLWKNDPGLARSRSTSGLQIRPMFGPLGGGVTGTF